MSERKHSARVLLVGQQSDRIERLRSHLARGGYQTIISNHTEAQARIIHSLPDAAIIDSGSEPRESLAVCHHLRLSTGPLFPLLMITSDEGRGQPERNFRSCADDYLIEPIDGEILLVRLSVLLKRKQAQAADTAPEDPSFTPAAEIDHFLRLTEAACADLALGKSGTIALISAKPMAETASHEYAFPHGLDEERMARQQKLRLAELSHFLASRLSPAPNGLSMTAPYGSFSLFTYQPSCTATELADQLNTWRDEYHALDQGDLIAGIASFPEDAANILDLIGLADEALTQARSLQRIVRYWPKSETTPVPRQRQLLIVDDSQEQVEMLDLLVKQEGYQTLRAYNGEQALDVLSEQHPDLLLLDLVMPRLNGFDVMHRLRDRNGGRLQPPVIMITANDCEESVLRGFELGARDYIIKPYHPRELLSRIQSILSVPTLTRGQ